MYTNLEKVLVSKEEINSKVIELAAQISKDYEGLNPLFVCILKGSVFFFSDLLRNFTIPVQMEFMSVSSYGAGTISTGALNIKKDLSENIENRHVIIVEDIIDTGNTLYKLKNLLLKRNPASIKIIALLDKPERRTAPMEADYVGFVIRVEFVIGFGLDYVERFRELKDVCVLSRSVYEK